MSTRIARFLGLALIALGSTKVGAQTPAIPGGGAGVGAAAGAGLASESLAGAGGFAGAAAPQKTIWGFFGLSKANCRACRSALCSTELGQRLNSLATGPASAISGGLIPSFCPPLTPQQIAALPGGPQGAAATAAKIKQSEAEAKARVAAVEYLGTVDCNHWPEATKALIDALRADPNECVRFAAARVLNSGCCCSKAVIDALKVSVAGTDEDGNPPETSSRVKAAAFSALQGCLMRVPEELPPEPVRPPAIGSEPSLEALPPPILEPASPSASNPTPAPARDVNGRTASFRPVPPPRTYDEALRRKTFTRTVEEAKTTLRTVSETAQAPAILPPGRQSVLDALLKARHDTGEHKAAATSAPAATRDGDVRPTSGSAPAPAPASTSTTARDRAASTANGDDNAHIARRTVFGSLFRGKATASATSN